MVSCCFGPMAGGSSSQWEDMAKQEYIICQEGKWQCLQWPQALLSNVPPPCKYITLTTKALISGPLKRTFQIQIIVLVFVLYKWLDRIELAWMAKAYWWVSLLFLDKANQLVLLKLFAQSTDSDTGCLLSADDALWELSGPASLSRKTSHRAILEE